MSKGDEINRVYDQIWCHDFSYSVRVFIKAIHILTFSTDIEPYKLIILNQVVTAVELGVVRGGLMQSSITFDVFTHLQLHLISVLAMSFKWISLICAVRNKFSLNHSLNVLFSNQQRLQWKIIS